MSQWISIEAAAEKYRLEKEYIWLWVEMKKITVSYENDTVSIDDDSIQQFIKRTKLGITSEYIDERCVIYTQLAWMSVVIIIFRTGLLGLKYG